MACDVEVAKVYAMILGLELDRRVGFAEFILEIDCSVVAAKVKQKGTGLSSIGALMEMVREILVGLPCKDVSVVYRQQNRLADSLASYASAMSDQIYWFENLLTCVSYSVISADIMF